MLLELDALLEDAEEELLDDELLDEVLLVDELELEELSGLVLPPPHEQSKNNNVIALSLASAANCLSIENMAYLHLVFATIK